MRALWLVFATFAFATWDLSYDHGAVIGTVYGIARELLRPLGLA